MRIERIAHGVGVPVLREIDMRHLRARVHAGIGAAGALHQGFLARQRFDRRGQDALHGEPVGLDLPAGKRRAVIFDDELVAGHDQATRAPALTGVPRRNSSACIGCRPARCTCMSRTAPSPQAIVNLSSSTVPGAPLALAFGRAQRLDAHAADLEPGAGKRRQPADVVVHLCPACSNRCAFRPC